MKSRLYRLPGKMKAKLRGSHAPRSLKYGVLILLAVALFTNNVVHHRQYPRHWL